MADREAARETTESYVASTTPDVCLTPMGAAVVPVPYSIIGPFQRSVSTVGSVLFTKNPAFHLDSRIATVIGDEAGTAGGVASGVNLGFCRPIESSSTVKAKGAFVVRHGDLMLMNCAGPEGAGNTQGKVVFVKVAQKAKVDDEGNVEVEEEPAAKPATLTEADYDRAAKSLGVDKAAVKAVADVESAGSGFYSNGHPKVRFEGHQFHKLTGGKYSAKYPKLSHKGYTGKYNYNGVKEVTERLDKAVALDESAAMKATSWGKFQIMGFNHERAGYDSVQKFAAAMGQSEGKQLDAFANFIKSDKTLHQALKDKKWAAFAKRYNGAGYKKNAYDTKLKHAYQKHVREQLKAGKDGVKVTAPKTSKRPKKRPAR